MVKNSAIEEFKNKSFKKANGLTTNSAVIKAYGFSNETLRQYYHLLKCDNGRVATVGSSGDQTLYAVFNGAREVTLIDANPYAKPVTELKISAIKNMSLKEFLNYWTIDEVLKDNNYKHLLSDCSEETKKFFKYIRFKQHKDGKVLAMDVFNHITFDGLYPISDKEHWYNNCEFYDNEVNFEKLKLRLAESDVKIRYRLAEYSKFPRELNGEYDSILLSNICDYYNGREDEFFSIAKALKERNLSKNGTIQLHYELSGRAKLGEMMPDNYKKDIKYSVYEVGACNDPNLYLRGRIGDFYSGKAVKIKESDPIKQGKELVYICEK